MSKARVLRYITLAAAGAAAAGCWTRWRYRRWHAAAMHRLCSRSRVLQTASGPMEFATLGQGRPVVVLHGLLGGYDQGLAIAELLDLPQFQFIAVSRPGYLRTPLETGRTFDEQADAIAALLDELKISSASIIGVSAGGAPALAFARRHPGRCEGLVLLSGVTRRLLRTEVELPKVINLAESALADAGSWLLQRGLHWNARFLAAGALLPDEIDMLRDGSIRKAFLLVTDTFVPLSPRIPGMYNDEEQVKTLPEAVCPVPCSRVLLVHGTLDRLVPYDCAAAQAAVIPGSELLPIPGGGHMAGIFRAVDVRGAIARLLAPQGV